MGAAYHHEGITNPQRVPPLRTMWNLNSLAVNCNYHSWCLTYCTSGKGKGERIWFTEWICRKQQSFFRSLHIIEALDCVPNDQKRRKMHFEYHFCIRTLFPHASYIYKQKLQAFFQDIVVLQLLHFHFPLWHKFATDLCSNAVIVVGVWLTVLYILAVKVPNWM